MKWARAKRHPVEGPQRPLARGLKAVQGTAGIGSSCLWSARIWMGEPAYLAGPRVPYRIRNGVLEEVYNNIIQ